MKQRILARRRMLIAAAFAAACDKTPEQPPQPCLSQVYIPPDAGPVDATNAPDDTRVPLPVDAAPSATKTRAVSPAPCLTTTAPPRNPPKP